MKNILQVALVLAAGLTTLSPAAFAQTSPAKAAFAPPAANAMSCSSSPWSSSTPDEHEATEE